MTPSRKEKKSRREHQPPTAEAVYKLTILLAVGLVLDLLVSAFVGVVAIQANHAASQAHIARVTSTLNCQSGNQFRKDNEELWKAVLTLIHPTTPAGRAFVDSVSAKVEQTFALHICTPAVGFVPSDGSTIPTVPPSTLPDVTTAKGAALSSCLPFEERLVLLGESSPIEIVPDCVSTMGEAG